MGFDLSKCMHFCGSKYAYLEVSNNYPKSKVEYLVEPISLDFLRMGNLDLPQERDDIVLYNPAKPSGLMAELVNRGRFNYVPLKGFTPAGLAEMFKKDFQVSYDSMVIKEVRNVWSNCEHHTVLFGGQIFVAYIPEYWNGKDDSEGYRVIGLSKIPRIVDMCARRLQLQEKLNADIAECIQLATGSNRVYGRSIMSHGCVQARGARSEGATDVTYISPRLRQDAEARKEIEGKVQELHLSSCR